jgi:hypothetical protein
LIHRGHAEGRAIACARLGSAAVDPWTAVPADAAPHPPGVAERSGQRTASPWLAIAAGVTLLGAGYAAMRTGLATTAIGGYAQGDEPRPWPAGLTTVCTLLVGAGLAWAARVRRVAVVGTAAAAALLVALTIDENLAVISVALAVAGVSVGAAAVALPHARTVHRRRRRAALIAIVLAVATSLGTGDVLAVLALPIVLPLGAASAAILLPDGCRVGRRQP